MVAPCLRLEGIRRAFFIGIGGGGDVITASILALSFERCGGEAVIGSIVWERFVHDPIPGPIRLEELRDAELLGDGVAIVRGDSYAVRSERKIVPQAVHVARALGRDIVVVDIYGGPKAMARALSRVLEIYDLDIAIGVDVGGDVLAKGFEEDLWSPLADSIGLAALARLGDDRALLAVASPGADGELDPIYVLRRVSEIASMKGFVGGYVLNAVDGENLHRVLSIARSEASSIPLKAINGYFGELWIRRGTRRVSISPLNAVVFFLKPSVAIKDSVARYVYEAEDLYNAREILNKACIYTELDLEEDIYRELSTGRSIEEIDVLRLRAERRAQLCELS